MTRREFLPLAAAPALGFQTEKGRLKITGVRIVKTRPRRPVPSYQPAPGSWSTQGVEVASPMSVYPEYKAQRSSFLPNRPEMGGFWVEIATDKGVKGYGQGGPGGGFVIENHLARLLVNEDPFNIERIWDILYRSSLSYGQKGIAIHALSGIDLALWDLIGTALGEPVYRLIGGAARPRTPAYCTGNDIEQHVEFGFQMLKLAMPHGPADGREGMRNNEAVVKRARAALGPDGEIMLDCWMAWTERYTLEMAEMLAPYRIYWMEEVLPPYDYAGYGRLNSAIRSTRIATGEHEYTRYGFRELLAHRGASIWQPDIHWGGGLTELRRIAALAAAHDIPVIPHGGGVRDGIHFIQATTNAPWAEMFMPAPGGPREVYRRFEEDNRLSRGPAGIYMQATEAPGFGHEIEVAS